MTDGLILKEDSFMSKDYKTLYQIYTYKTNAQEYDYIATVIVQNGVIFKTFQITEQENKYEYNML